MRSLALGTIRDQSNRLRSFRLVTCPNCTILSGLLPGTHSASKHGSASHRRTTGNSSGVKERLPVAGRTVPSTSSRQNRNSLHPTHPRKVPIKRSQKGGSDGLGEVRAKKPTSLKQTKPVGRTMPELLEKLVKSTARHESPSSKPRPSSAKSVASNPFAFTRRSAKNDETPRLDAMQNALFDVFRVKEESSAAVKLSEGSVHDAVVFRQYSELLSRTVDSNRIKLTRQHTSKPIQPSEAGAVLSWLSQSETRVPYSFPSLTQALNDGLSPMRHNSRSQDETLKNRHQDAFRSEVEQQQRQFCDTTGWNDSQYTMARNALFIIANSCAKQAVGLPIQVVWEKVKEGGMLMDKRLLQVLLYVAGTSSAGSQRKSAMLGKLMGTNSILDILNKANSSNNSCTANIRSEDMVDQVDEIALCHDLLYEPTEQTINIRIRLLVAQGKGLEAENLLQEFSGEVELRLRTYAPVLFLFLEQGNLSAALRLFKCMQQSQLVHLDATTYVNLLAALARQGAFRKDAPPIESAQDFGYAAASGPELLDDIVTDMAAEIMEIPLASAKRLYDAFADGFPNSGLEITSSLSPLQASYERAADSEFIASRVFIDQLNGQCPRSGITLRLIHLSNAEKEKMKDAILSLARTSQTKLENSKSPSKTSRRRAADEELSRFFKWLDQRTGEPFTAVIDAANVAYYLQNFEDGRFSFHQIEFVVEALESLGEHPLVVLPTKYTQPSFYVTIGAGSASGPKRQTQTKEELAIKNKLIESGKVFVVPSGCLDDYFWILASVCDQSASRRGQDLQVAPGAPNGRWPGTRPVLISNDQMRDHKLELLEPMLFRRWYSNCIVNYTFTEFNGERCVNSEIGFSPADFFSREIQGNRDASGSMVWHMPLADCQDEWLCLRIPLEQAS